MLWENGWEGSVGSVFLEARFGVFGALSWQCFGCNVTDMLFGSCNRYHLRPTPSYSQ